MMAIIRTGTDFLPTVVGSDEMAVIMGYATSEMHIAVVAKMHTPITPQHIQKLQQEFED